MSNEPLALDEYLKRHSIEKGDADDEDEDEDEDEDDALVDDPLIDEDQSSLPDNSLLDDKGESGAVISPINSEIDSEDEDHLQKFEPESANEYIRTIHPECLTSNAVEIEGLTVITRDKNNRIIDENHLTNPFLSKYERTRILGQRAKQLNSGHKPYIKVPAGIIDGYLIAELELKEKKIPVIVRRPLPGGRSEYWKLQDLEQIY